MSWDIRTDDNRTVSLDVAVVRKNKMDGGFENDLDHRDITINDIAHRIHPDGSLDEPVGHPNGLTDVKEKRIQMVNKELF